MNLTKIKAARAGFLAKARATDDPGEKHWCKVFIANLDLMASDNEEERERGKRMFVQNTDWYTRLFLPVQRMRMEKSSEKVA
jgi:hypothetical protein